MSDAQVRLGVLLSVALLAVAGLLRFWEPEPEALDPDSTAAVWSVESDQVVRIARERGAETLVLAKDGEDWRVESPYVAPADAWAAKDLVNDVTDIDRGIPIAADDPAAFGLGDPPEARVTVTLADGTTKTLDVGKGAPVGNRTYVRAADGAVAAVGVDLSSLQTDVEAFRDRRLVRFEIGEVTGVRVEGPEGTLDLTESDSGWWLAGFTRADAESLEMLLRGLLDLRFDEVLAEAEAPAVEDPEYTVTIALEGGASRRFVVGRTPGIKGKLVAVEGGSTGWVSPDTLRLLGQGPVDLGDQQAFPVDPSAVSRVEVALGDTRWALERSGEAWLRDGVEAPAGQEAIDALDRAGIDYAPPPIPPLAETWGTVTVVEGDATRIVDVGQVHASKWRVAKDRAGGEPYLVPLSDLTVLAAALD